MQRERLVARCDSLVEQFSEKTSSFPMDRRTEKNCVIWSLNYNIIKIEFVLTEKEKLMCPASTLFCRIYLGKNDFIYFHIPELVEFLDSENFQCYYFSYLESEERLEKCFRVLEGFLLEHFSKITDISQNQELYKELLKSKVDEVYRLGGVKPGDEEEEFLPKRIEVFEKYILLPRMAGDYAYRDFMKGNYGKAVKIYQKSIAKDNHLTYEKRLLEFIITLQEPYEVIPKECASVLEMEKFSGAKAEGITMLKGLLLGEVIFGGIACLLLAALNCFMGKDAIYYYATPWYWGLVIGGLPALLGSIALRNQWAKILRRKEYEKALEYDSLVNGKGVNRFANITFATSILAAVFFLVQFLTCDTAFCEDKMWFGAGDAFISMKKTTCYYEDLEEVVYSEGVYNYLDEFINRPSYLLIFEDGTVWDSDGYTSVEQVEEEILPLLEEYYEEIHAVEARNEYID